MTHEIRTPTIHIFYTYMQYIDYITINGCVIMQSHDVTELQQ